MRASVAALGHPAQMDWQPLSNAGRFMVIIEIYSPKLKWRQVQECMVSAMVEQVAFVWGSMG